MENIPPPAAHQLLPLHPPGARSPLPPPPSSSVNDGTKVHSLRSKFPELAKEFHPMKNRMKSIAIPWDSKLPIWWKCPNGPDHEWQDSIRNRIEGRVCPCCLGVKVGGLGGARGGECREGSSRAKKVKASILLHNARVPPNTKHQQPTLKHCSSALPTPLPY